jgi:Tol biopolymer transport system component
MQANTTTPHPRVSDLVSWLAAVFGVVLLLLLLLSFVLESPEPASTPATTSDVQTYGSVAYFEYGTTADTLWLASAADTAEREAVFSVPHAREFGVVSSLSPTGLAVVYAALPPGAAAPAADTPAELWYTPLKQDAEPRLIANGIDLLVAPVWTPDAKRVVYRRSDAAGYSLVEMPFDGGAERVLASSGADEALFPVGFSPDGATFYHVALSEDASRLVAVNTLDGSTTPIATLADGLTRDWALSPDGSRLAYLALEYTPEAINSRAYVIDLATASVEAVTSTDTSAFGPVWDHDGALVIGTLTPAGESSFVRIEDGETSRVLGPEAGFDVPLAYLPGGAYLVRTFEGASATAPGRSTLTLVDSDQERHVLSQGDVTFVGWSAR